MTRQNFLFLWFFLIGTTNSALCQKSTKLNWIHFRPENSKAGDVIPYFENGNYHIFYLNNNNWSHLVTKDLTNWKELPDALVRDSGSLAPDGEACWTGSIVKKGALYYLFYTGKNSKDPHGDQKVMMALSKDLIAWQKKPDYTFYADGKMYWNKSVNGAIDDKLIYHHQAFRDPDVFRNQKTSEWWMVLHATLADGSSPAMGLYTSGDLIHWKPSTPLLVYPGKISGDCPYLIHSKNNSFLNFADFHYLSSNYPDGPYQSEPKAFDCGDLRVPKVMWDGKRFILIGWIADYKDKKDSGSLEWGGTLCMPRELWTDSLGNEYQRPLLEIINSFKSVATGSSKNFITGADVKVPGDFMFHTKLVVNKNVKEIKIDIPYSGDSSSGAYNIFLDFKQQKIGIASKYKAYSRLCRFSPEEPLDVRIFMLGNVWEIFINETWAFTMHAYQLNRNKIVISAQRGGFRILNYEVGRKLL